MNASTSTSAAITAEEVAELRVMITDLRRRNADLTANRASAAREAIPADGAFGGAKFIPVGHDARTEFAPFGPDQHATHGAYHKTVKPTGQDPGTSSGLKGNFESWVIKMADKFAEDLETFRTERSRMALIFAKVEGLAEDMLQDRYQSIEEPFTCAAEIIQTSAATYVNHNQAVDARTRLAKIKFDPFGNQSISELTSEINSLATKAKISWSERKALLYNFNPKAVGSTPMRALNNGPD